MTDAERADRFRCQILEWAGRHGRDFPWRHTEDPYRVLVAEMMLRRTRADQVVPVYQRFVARFPDVASLAAASEAEAAALLRPLGLAWRVPAFRQLARQILERWGGRLPLSRDALLTLPGVGDYVASAVLCFAGGVAVPIVDTNTVRVAGRFFGFPTHAESRRLRHVREAVARLVTPDAPRESSLALLDFAALVCVAGRPRCEQCPVSLSCAWFRASRPIAQEVATR